MFTTAEKFACVARELNYRIRVYSRLVSEKRMTEQQAARELAIMGEIVEDYRALRERETPELDLA